MDALEIKYRLARKGIKQMDIAKNIGVSRATISYVVNGHSPSARIREAVAEALGLPVGDIWPDDDNPSIN